MKVQRMKSWARLLETLPAKFLPNFNMSEWGTSRFRPYETKTCDSSACALGWAAVHPLFNKRGLVQGRFGPVLKDMKTGKIVERDQETVAMKFFGLDHEQAAYIIYATPIDDPKEIAQRIREMIA